MSSFRVPAIDISPYVTQGSASSRAAVAEAMDHACSTVGFVQIHGHGIDPGVIAGLTDAADAFFGLPLAEKNRWRRPASENRGYSPPKSESLRLSLDAASTNYMNDFFEAFNVGRSVDDYPNIPDDVRHHYATNTWPDVDGFDSAVWAYFGEAERVATTMTTIFADALHLPVDYFTSRTGHSVNTLRINNYALPEDTQVPTDGELIGMGEHTDYGIVTVLWADQAPGLQILGSDGAWHDVRPDDGALLINLGDLTARLTNERWLSTLHRVRPPVVDGRVQRRRSAAFFFDANADALVAPHPSFVDASRPALYEPVTVDEHLRAKLAGSRIGIPNTAAERESARLHASSSSGTR
ncbi:isopenicillin N synthase family dioxygenase [Mycolicibacterium smegmatis]|uniref:isopenicillin N synthase family dioxygenase n=1 Tax=Mycolicibacterium smegmatis TaxID=1772 RepID=UPI0013038D11|nr:2-oxoglutarate and iron-dependent oxygenase domain-containing protein [Mycolicibacterium smegmatis]